MEAFFQKAEGMCLVGIARDGEAGLEAIRCLHPHVVLLDLVLPRLSGVGLLRALTDEMPGAAAPDSGALSGKQPDNYSALYGAGG